MKSCSLINNGLYNQGLAPLGKAWSLNLAIAFGKGLLLFWASRSYSGTAGYNSEPSKQTEVKWSLSWSRALENCGKAVL